MVVEILYDLTNHIKKKDTNSSLEFSDISLQDNTNVSTLILRILSNLYLMLYLYLSFVSRLKTETRNMILYLPYQLLGMT